MTTDVASRVSELVEPLIKAHGADLYDVVHGGATLQVLVGGDVDLEDLADLTREISAVLDDADPMPDRYYLEVSSPGLERPLRQPRHFQAAVGSKVKIKTKPHVEGERRVDGELLAADDSGCTVATAEGPRTLAYDDIDRARTVFEWGPTPKPGSAKKGTTK